MGHRKLCEPGSVRSLRRSIPLTRVICCHSRTCCSDTVSVGTILAHNYISLAAGASLWGAALSEAGVMLDSASIVLARKGPAFTTRAGTAIQSRALTAYVAPVNMLSAKTFVLLAADGLTNTVRIPLRGYSAEKLFRRLTDLKAKVDCMPTYCRALASYLATSAATLV